MNFKEWLLLKECEGGGPFGIVTKNSKLKWWGALSDLKKKKKKNEKK